jgi:hypothetical protein
VEELTDFDSFVLEQFAKDPELEREMVRNSVEEFLASGDSLNG